MRAEDLTIFIVDDDESVRRAVKRLMKSMGYPNVETFACAEDFLHSADPKEPSLLVIDLLLPGMGGIDLYRHLKKVGHTSQAVFVSASEEELDRARTECSDVLASLKKPFEHDNLDTAVSLACAKICDNFSGRTTPLSSQ